MAAATVGFLLYSRTLIGVHPSVGAPSSRHCPVDLSIESIASMDEDEITPRVIESQQELNDDDEDDQPQSEVPLCTEEAEDTVDKLPEGSEETLKKLRVQKFGAEWSLFTDVGPWKKRDGSETKFRVGSCNHCKTEVRGKRETLSNHIKKCYAIPAEIRAMYNDSEYWFRTGDEETPLEFGKRQSVVDPCA